MVDISKWDMCDFCGEPAQFLYPYDNSDYCGEVHVCAECDKWRTRQARDVAMDVKSNILKNLEKYKKQECC